LPSCAPTRQMPRPQTTVRAAKAVRRDVTQDRRDMTLPLLERMFARSPTLTDQGPLRTRPFAARSLCYSRIRAGAARDNAAGAQQTARDRSMPLALPEPDHA